MSPQLRHGPRSAPRLPARLDRQLWAGQRPHYGRVYDQHTGLDYPMTALTTVAAARSGTVVGIEEGSARTSTGLTATLSGSATLTVGTPSTTTGSGRSARLVGPGRIGGQAHRPDPDAAVSATGRISTSNCSYRVALHSVDPMAGRLWTTWPGRVAYLAAYHSESNGSTVAIKRLTTITHWVQFRNTGGRTWSRDAAGSQLLLGTWRSAARSSVFRAADWPLVGTHLPDATSSSDGWPPHVRPAGAKHHGELLGVLQPAGRPGPVVSTMPGWAATTSPTYSGQQP